MFIKDLGTGVKDFFYLPKEGFVNGPLQGGRGLVVGTASLCGNTFKGAFGSVSRLTNTASKSLLIVACDSDAVTQR